MRLTLTRKTGFYGMASAIKIFKNNSDFFFLDQNATKTLEITESSVNLQAKLLFLKSQVYKIDATAEDRQFELKINPKVLTLYVSFFTLFFILPILFQSWLLGLGVVFAYVIFVAIMSRKFYVLEEIS